MIQMCNHNESIQIEFLLESSFIRLDKETSREDFVSEPLFPTCDLFYTASFCHIRIKTLLFNVGFVLRPVLTTSCFG